MKLRSYADELESVEVEEGKHVLALWELRRGEREMKLRL